MTIGKLISFTLDLLKIILKTLLFILTILIAYSANLKWFILAAGIRINYFEILIIVFLMVFCLSRTCRGNLSSSLRTFIYLHWGIFGISVMSGISIILYFSQLVSYGFFFKGLLQLFVYTMFFTALVLYLCSISKSQRRVIIFNMVAIVIFSAIYAIAQLTLMLDFGIDIDKLLATTLFSFGDIDTSLTRFAYGDSFRICGISSEPATFGTTIITVVPLLFGYIFYERKHYLIIPLILLFLTLVASMSISTSLGLICALFLWVVLSYRHIRLHPLHLIVVFIFMGSVTLLYLSYKDEIAIFSAVRFSTGGTMSYHLEIALKVLQLVYDNLLLGLGYNNFSIAYEATYNGIGYNTHCSWLTYLVETGFIGLVFQFITSFFILRVCLKKRTLLSIAFAASYVGVCIAAIGYEVKAQFSFQFYTVVLFTIICVDEINLMQPFAREQSLKK